VSGYFISTDFSEAFQHFGMDKHVCEYLVVSNSPRSKKTELYNDHDYYRVDNLYDFCDDDDDDDDDHDYGGISGSIFWSIFNFLVNFCFWFVTAVCDSRL
jgi:hypothetical protein